MTFSRGQFLCCGTMPGNRNGVNGGKKLWVSNGEKEVTKRGNGCVVSLGLTQDEDGVIDFILFF